MTDFEQKYKEFIDAFKKAVFDGEFNYRVDKSCVTGYNGKITFYVGKLNVEFTVARNYVCYHNKLLDEIFDKDEIKALNDMIDKYFSKDKEKYDRIEQLKRELAELEKEIA